MLKAALQSFDAADYELDFPKGRKQYKGEPEIDCAMREFQEETGIDAWKLVNEKKMFLFQDKSFKIKDHDKDINLTYLLKLFLAVIDSSQLPMLQDHVNFDTKETEGIII